MQSQQGSDGERFYQNLSIYRNNELHNGYPPPSPNRGKLPSPQGHEDRYVAFTGTLVRVRLHRYKCYNLHILKMKHNNCFDNYHKPMLFIIKTKSSLSGKLHSLT
jgi:hypothetical protein